MFKDQITSILNNLDDIRTSSSNNHMLLQQFQEVINNEIKNSENPAKTTAIFEDHLIQINRLLEQVNSNLENESIRKKIQKLIQQLFNLTLVQTLNINLTGINELHLNYHIGDLLILPTTSKTAFLYDWMSRDISKLYSMIEKVGNVIRITQGPRKHVGIFKNKIILFLPIDYSGFITIRNESDQICVANLQSKCMLDITSATGNVLLNNLQINRLQADLKSGNITLNKCQAEDIHVNTHSGTISTFNVKDTKADAETLLTSTSGNIKVDSFTTHRLVIETKSGNIQTKNLNKINCDFSTLTGNIKGNNFTGRGIIKNNTGKIKLSLSSNFNQKLEVINELGAIKINIAKDLPLQFHTNGRLAAINLPLDAIIFDNNDYNKIDGYLINEHAQPSLSLTSAHGKIELKNNN